MLATEASGFVDPPILIPQNPVAGEAVTVSIRNGECDGFVSAPPLIAQTGNAIHMRLESVHYGDFVLCNVPTTTSSFRLPALPAGDYTLYVARFYETPASKIVNETLGNYEFSVRGPTSIVALPFVGITSSLLMALGLFALAWRRV